jgi:hypothetical protein
MPKGGDVHYVAVEQDVDQSPQGLKANLASEGKPWIINPLLKIMQLPLLCLCIYVHELNETLDA